MNTSCRVKDTFIQKCFAMSLLKDITVKRTGLGIANPRYPNGKRDMLRKLACDDLHWRIHFWIKVTTHYPTPLQDWKERLAVIAGNESDTPTVIKDKLQSSSSRPFLRSFAPTMLLARSYFTFVSRTRLNAPPD
jgi:hypothetical protein